MAHDFENFPELTNSQVDFYYWESPHKQIFEDFKCKVVKVIDGDTIRVKWDERDFEFPVRFLGTDAPELNEGGKESMSWLETQIEGEEVEIIIDIKQRVGKFGRILGIIMSKGINMNEESIKTGHAKIFNARGEGKIPDIRKELAIEKWF